MKTEKNFCSCCGGIIKKEDKKKIKKNWGVCYQCEKELIKL
jgi:LEA14-like dessication related protein